MNFNKLLGSAALAVAVVGGAHGATIQFTSAAAFAAATSGDTTYGFAGIAPDTSYVGELSPYTAGPVTFTGNHSLFVMGANAGFAVYGLPFLSAQPGSPNILTLSTAPTTAIGFDYGSYYNSSDILTIQLSDGSVFSANLPYLTARATSFLGFTSTTPISSITITDTSPVSVIDITDFVLGQSVPEPATWALMMAGFGALGAALRLQRRTTPDTL